MILFAYVAIYTLFKNIKENFALSNLDINIDNIANIIIIGIKYR